MSVVARDGGVARPAGRPQPDATAYSHAAEEGRAPPLLSARSVSKRFGSTLALADASLDLRPGEVCGLLGANGAGKSTLSRIVSGHVAASGGTISFDGQPYAARSTRDALSLGIALVAQETSLAPDLSVLENIFLPDLARPGRLSQARSRERASEILRRLGHEHALPLDQEVRGLSAAQRQLVEIAKALALDARLVIFDEPTASLSAAEVSRLFGIMGQMREEGRALAFVSHRLEEVLAITDRVTILRDGVSVAQDVDTATLTQGDIIRHMVGRDIGAVHRARAAGASTRRGAPVLEVEHLRAEPWVRDVSFLVRPGEILGLGGLVGAGRSEAAEAIFGLRPRQGGSIRIDGAPARLNRPADAIAAGIGLVAEDRRGQSIVPDLSVFENIMLARMGQHRAPGRGHRAAAAQRDRIVADLGLPADRMGDSLLSFSGGMQQKVIIARWLLTNPRVLILDEPTKGVDIGTRASIYRLLQETADAGMAVVVISSDFEELLGLCERIVVVSDGLTIADLSADRLTEERLMLLAAPRTSTRRNVAALRAMADEHGGQAFWALVDDEELICLAVEAAAGAPATGLEPGRSFWLDETAIPAALAARGGGFTVDPEAGAATMLVQMTDERGHDMGWIGLSVPDGQRPDAGALRDRVGRLTRHDGEA